MADAEARENERHLASVRKNRKEVIRISVWSYLNGEVIGLQVWNDEGDPRPRKYGINLQADKLDDLIAGLQNARAALNRGGKHG